ncbi:MAG: 50S ribosomal protein L18e [archaeon]
MVVISKTKIKFNSKRKTNPEVAETLSAALKNKGWLKIAKLIASPRRKYSEVNLSEINKLTTSGDTVIIVGKVLSSGELAKKVRICAFNSSAKVAEKIKASKSEIVSILDEIKKNPKGEGLKLIS